MSSASASLFNEAQKVTLVVVSWVAALVSTLGSAAIVYTLIVDKVEKKHSPFRRILTCASLFDIVGSGTVIVMAGWAVPRDEWTIGHLARGNVNTCNVMGFLLVCGQGSQMLYSASLALYHLFVVRYQYKLKTISRFLEPAIHGFSIVSPIVFASFVLRIEYINSWHLDPGTCSLSTNPPNCMHYPDIDCVRGHRWEKAHNMCLVVFCIFLALSWLIMMASNVLIWLTVRSTERRMQRYGRGSSRAASLILTREVGMQGMMFVACFTAANLLMLVRETALYPLFETSYANRGLYFGVQLTSLPLVQLQGFFHALVFFRPRWHALVQPGRAWECFSREKIQPNQELKEGVVLAELGSHDPSE